MNQPEPDFEAFAFHPDFGNEMAGGRISVDRWALHFQSETMALQIPLDKLLIKLGAKKDNRIYFSDPGQPGLKIFTADDSILEHRAFGQSNPVRHQLTAMFGGRELWRRVRVTCYFLMVGAVVAWLGSLVMGAMVRVAVNRIPVKWETDMGNSLVEKLSARLPFVTDTNAVAQLAAFAEPLTRVIPAKGIEFKFHILANPEPNAFALPGGHIVVTTGLLNLAGRPEELLGVIAHESAHVTQRHADRHAISGKGPVLMLQVLAGGRNKLLEALAYPTEMLAYESFSQEYEREADSVGWNYLVAAKINPHGMIDMFQKLKASEDKAMGGHDLPAFDSHPALDKRIGWLNARWDKIPDKTGFIELTNPIPKIPESDLENLVKGLLL